MQPEQGQTIAAAMFALAALLIALTSGFHVF